MALGSDESPQATAADVRTVAKGSIIQFLGIGTNRASGVVFVAIAIRLLGATSFGLYRQIAQLLQTLSMLSMLGFDAALIRSVARARARGEMGAIRSATRTAVVIVTAVSITLYVILFIAASPLASAFADDPSRQDQMAFLIRLGGAYVPFFALAQLLSAGTTGYKTVLPAVLVGNILQPLSLLLLSVAAILLGYGVMGAMWGMVASALLALLAAVRFYIRLLPHDDRQDFEHTSFRSMAAFALPRAGSSALRLGIAGTLLVGVLGTDRDVALFAVALSLQSVALVFPQAFLSIWPPMVVDLLEGGKTERLRALYKTITRWVASCSFGFIVALAVLPEPFVLVLGGSAVQDAALLTTIIALGTLFQVATGPCGMLITMAGYPTVLLLNSIAIISLYVVAAWLLVPTYGVVGMAVIHGAATAANNLLLVLAAQWLTRLQPFGRSFLKPVLSTTLAGLFLLLWRSFFERALLPDVVGLILGGTVYLGVLLATGMNAEDRIVLERLRARFRGIRLSKSGDVVP